MNENIEEILSEFCRTNGVTIKHDVAESCILLEKILSSFGQNDNFSLSLNKINNDLLMSIETPEEISVFSRLFAEATFNAKCYDIYNTGSGIKIIITYENAIQ